MRPCTFLSELTSIYQSNNEKGIRGVRVLGLLKYRQYFDCLSQSRHLKTEEIVSDEMLGANSLPFEFPPASSNSVAYRSTELTISWLTEPLGIVPGHQANAGIRIPPSQVDDFPPEKFFIKDVNALLWEGDVTRLAPTWPRITRGYKRNWQACPFRDTQIS